MIFIRDSEQQAHLLNNIKFTKVHYKEKLSITSNIN